MTTLVCARSEPGLRAVLLPGLRSFVARVIVVVAVASAIGLVLTHVLDHTALGDLDRSVAHDLVSARTSTLDRLTGWGTLPADPIPVAVVWAFVVVAAAVRTRRWVVPVFVLFAVGGEKLSYFLTTLVVRRPRPDVPTIGTRHVTSSFPSGHVGSAISLYGALAVLFVLYVARSRRAKVLAALVVAAIAVEVALCRMYRGHHFLTDVVVGAVIGTTWVVLAAHLVRVLARDEDAPGPVQLSSTPPSTRMHSPVM